MIGIKMKPNIPVHYQKGKHITHYRRVAPPLPTYKPTALSPPPPPPPQF